LGAYIMIRTIFTIFLLQSIYANAEVNYYNYPAKSMSFNSGIDLTGGQKDDSGFVGVSYSFSGDVRNEGAQIKLNYGLSKFDYLNPVVTSGQVDGRTDVVKASAGYKFLIEQFELGAYAGLSIIQLNRTPNDFTAKKREGTNTGSYFLLEAENRRARNYFLSALAEYSSIDSRYFSRMRLGPKFFIGDSWGNISIGPEVAYLGEDNWGLRRYGGYLRYEYAKDFEFWVAAGNSKNTKSVGGDGTYVSMDFNWYF
jgi:hypothetical protein